MDQKSIRDELAQVIHLYWDSPVCKQENPPHVEHIKQADAILASPVIRRLQAEAWEEGKRSGYENVARDMWDDGEALTNPYREKDA